jgi:hypothetical protein
MNPSIIAPILLLSLTFVIILVAFACPGPIYTTCRAAFVSLRHYRREQQTSRRGGGRSEQITTRGHEQQQQQQQQQQGRELEDLPTTRD